MNKLKIKIETSKGLLVFDVFELIVSPKKVYLHISEECLEHIFYLYKKEDVIMHDIKVWDEEAKSVAIDKEDINSITFL